MAALADGGVRVSDLLRLYDAAELRRDGYPVLWPKINAALIEEMGYRCERCGHPYRKGTHGSGEWSPCDELCTHGDPVRWTIPLFEGEWQEGLRPRHPNVTEAIAERYTVEARWRILTVHHLNMVKADCRWWNLAALCQRCHLTIQTRVKLDQTYPFEHSDWFKPHAAGYYARAYQGRDLTREEAITEMDELLALERLV